VGGNPARFIKKRFDDELIEKLLNSKWWELEEQKLKKLAPYMDKPELFLNKLSEEE
jgi:hypothetical protein